MVHIVHNQHADRSKDNNQVLSLFRHPVTKTLFLIEAFISDFWFFTVFDRHRCSYRLWS